MEMNNYNYLIDPKFSKLAAVNKSYHDGFKNLNNEELGGLCEHNSLLEKVHEEMPFGDASEQIVTFDQHLKVFHHYYGTNFSYWAPTNFRTVTESEYFHCIFEKLAQKSAAGGFHVGTEINQCLYEHTNVLNLAAVKHLTNGISLEKLTFYDGCREAVELVSSHVGGIWTSTDFTNIASLCETNQKWVFLLLYPYFIKPLGKIIWSTLLSHFHFVPGSFLIFLQKVSDLLFQGPEYNHIYRTVSVKKVIKLALGFNSVGLLALYNTFLSRNGGQIFLSNHRLYNSLRGFLGSGITFLRLKICR